MSGSNARTRNTADQDRRARAFVASHVANNPSGDHLQDVNRLRLLLEMLALLPGQEGKRVSSLLPARSHPSVGGGSTSDKRGNHYF